MSDFSNAPKEEVIQILLQNIGDLEKDRVDMNEAEFGNIDIQPAGIVMSGNEAKNIVKLLSNTNGILERLREINEKRSIAAYNMPLESWSPMEWGCAVAGELGEMCNFLKKMQRDQVDYTDDIAKEMADTIIYIDLLASLLGINLSDSIRDKFNEVSDKRGVDIKL